MAARKQGEFRKLLSSNDLRIRLAYYRYHISEATAARHRLRTSLKECRRADEAAKDWSAVLIAVQEYIPHLLAITKCVETDALLLKSDPGKSSTGDRSSLLGLSANLHVLTSYRCMSFLAPACIPHGKSRQDDLAACLLTLGLVLYNLAGRQVASLGDYEKQRQTSENERRRLDELINSAAEMLCRASGVFTYLSQTLLPERERSNGCSATSTLPIDLFQEMASALADISLADAGRLSIRRLMTKAISDMGIAPGHPLPRSHPSPSLLAKLHINVYTLYERACNSFDALSKSSGEVIPELKAYAGEGKKMYRMLAYKWLGVDLGEAGMKMGDAIAWLNLARSIGMEMGGKSGLTIGKNKVKRRSRVVVELESVGSFLKAYGKVNDKVSFQPIPFASSLLSLIPSGRSAVASKSYALPEPAFTSSDRSASLDASVRGLSLAEGDSGSDEDSEKDNVEKPSAGYALSGGYF